MVKNSNSELEGLGGGRVYIGVVEGGSPGAEGPLEDDDDDEDGKKADEEEEEEEERGDEAEPEGDSLLFIEVPPYDPPEVRPDTDGV